jgi:hypothetical protein
MVFSHDEEFIVALDAKREDFGRIDRADWVMILEVGVSRVSFHQRANIVHECYIVNETFAVLGHEHLLQNRFFRQVKVVINLFLQNSFFFSYVNI